MSIQSSVNKVMGTIGGTIGKLSNIGGQMNSKAMDSMNNAVKSKIDQKQQFDQWKNKNKAGDNNGIN